MPEEWTAKLSSKEFQNEWNARMKDLPSQFVVDEFKTVRPELGDKTTEGVSQHKKPKLAALSKFLTSATQPKVEAKSQPAPSMPPS